jgi:hypothetical protein
LEDQLTFKSKKPGTRIVAANWNISGSTQANATVVVEPAGLGLGIAANVVSTGESSFYAIGSPPPWVVG